MKKFCYFSATKYRNELEFRLSRQAKFLVNIVLQKILNLI